MPERLASFEGTVRCARSPPPLGLTLRGVTRERPGEEMVLAFSVDPPVEFPESLEDASVEQVGARRYRIASHAREWLIAASAVHVHREVAAEFYRAIPPRPVPLAKRLFWQLVLRVAASRPALAVLKAVRR